MCIINVAVVFAQYREVMREGIWSSAFLKCTITIISIYYGVFISDLIASENKIIANILSYCGKHSMMIMYFHIFSFSLVTKAVYYFTGKVWERTWTNTIPEFGFITGFVGILIPLLIDFCLRNFISLLKKCLPS